MLRLQTLNLLQLLKPTQRNQGGVTMPRQFLHALLTLSLLLGSLSAAQAASYTFTLINVPGAASTVAYKINAQGQIVGSYADATNTTHGFLLDKGVFTTIDAPSAASATGLLASTTTARSWASMSMPEEQSMAFCWIKASLPSLMSQAP